MCPQGLTGTRSVNVVRLPEDVAKRSANRAYDEKRRDRKKKRAAKNVAREEAKRRGEDVSNYNSSSEEGESEGSSPAPESSPPPEVPATIDLVLQQTGVAIGSSRLKRSRPVPKPGKPQSSAVVPVSSIT